VIEARQGGLGPEIARRDASRARRKRQRLVALNRLSERRDAAKASSMLVKDFRRAFAGG
jgi:hypothetical protein